MPLSCDCDFDGGDYSWYFVVPVDYSILETKRRRRCWSCKELIDIGAVVNQYFTHRPPKYDVEIKIYGEDGEICMQTRYHCECCADLAWSLHELGFCWSPDEDQHELVKQYVEFKKTGRMPEGDPW